MKTLRHTIAPEEEGRMVKQIARGTMGASHRLFSQVKFAGGVLLDGERALANARVRAGQVLELRLAEEAAPEADATHPAGAVNIVYEDEDLFVVDKCAPLPCQSSARQTGDTLEARMRAQMPGWTFRPVNRLDKGTSGLMVVARHAHAQDALQRDLHTDDFVREYLAVVEGAPQAEEGLDRCAHPQGGGGRPSGAKWAKAAKKRARTFVWKSAARFRWCACAF